MWANISISSRSSPDILNGNTTAADAILDRIVHTSKRFTLSGSSLRKK